MKKVFALFLFLLPGMANATHIVGGEFELLHLRDNVYRIRLIQYFDVVNGNPEARDDIIEANIFRKKDSVLMDSLNIPLSHSSRVQYTNPTCKDDSLITERIIYEETYTLDPDFYDDEGGYYIVWERCCRNNIISNIVRPDQTGQTFTITFPPLKRNGNRFINSSPQLFPPLSDYACVNQFYYADFRGYDPDGDSLVYSLVNPLNTSEFKPKPDPTPGPHPKVNWSNSYSKDNQISGNPSLSISDEGFITVRPDMTGLFVFSVKCEEYRDGEKIGEVIRDFQLLVLDCPDPGAKPQIFGKAPGDDEYNEEIGKVVLTPESDKNFEFAVVDTAGEDSIRIKSISKNFNEDVNHFFENTSIDTLAPGDTAKFSFNLDGCPLQYPEPAIIEIITLDNTCPLPLQDTIRLEVEFKDYNKPPVFTTPKTKEIYVNINKGEVLDLPIRIKDVDGDSIDVKIIPNGFDFDNFSMSFQKKLDSAGVYEQNLYWDTNCDRNLFYNGNEFQFKIVAEDRDECKLENPDSVIYNIQVNLPQNNAPELKVNGNEADRTMDVKIESLLNLNVTANDTDEEDSVILHAEGIDFELADFEMLFEEVRDKGDAAQNFIWDNQCGLVNLEERDTFVVRFIAEDKNLCKMPKSDTLTIQFNVLPPDNTAPDIQINGTTTPGIYEVLAGKNIALDFKVTDNEGDSIYLNLTDGAKYKPLIDKPVDSIRGLSVINDKMIWETSCDLLQPDFSDSTYTFKYVASDDMCYVPMSDTVTFGIKVKDIDVSYEFLPPNAFTPNGEDDFNPAFYIPDLPGNNCFSQFKKIVIYNRWGKEVFVSHNRDFRWNGMGMPTGVYYYALKYTHKTYKGHINLIK